MAHDQPTYASVPGIRVFGMMCVKPTSDTHNGYHIQRPAPPKRNQYYQTQLSYYNRFKKHTLSKLTAAQQKTNENAPNLSTQSSESSPADFTTRGISIIPGDSETREGDLNTEDVDTVPSTTFDAMSSSYSTTIPSTDSIPTESVTDPSSSSSRTKRDTYKTYNDYMMTDDVDADGGMKESRSQMDQEDWPSFPWDEVSEQIKNIQWD